MGMKMRGFNTNPFKAKPHFITMKLFSYALCAILPIAVVSLCFYQLTPITETPTAEFRHNTPPIVITSPVEDSPQKGSDDVKSNNQLPCHYSNGKWVPSELGPLYNGTSCGTIKDGQNCMSHGRPDLGYLSWRWQPNEEHCNVPRFDPVKFLDLMRNKHLAFVGDSVARNQLESLMCMLASVSSPSLVYSSGDDNKFRRWHFASWNVIVSVYWSPFLVKGIEKTEQENYNKLLMDSVDERWANDLGSIDMLVLSIGHWYLHPAVYSEGDSVLGCHYCPGLNHTEIGFYGVFGKAFRTALKAIAERKGHGGNGIDVVVTTFSPHHFEGEWDKAGACPKTEPYQEKELQAMDEEMREAELEAVEEVRPVALRESGGRVRITALDVTRLASLRPDGHPGPYMHPFPFANGVQDRVQHDCVHWCLPGPIDTWNEIMLEIMKGWQSDDSTR